MALISNSAADIRGVRDTTATGSTSRSDASVIFRGLVAFALANALWLIWSSRFPPFQDYPDWVYQGWLLSRIISGHAMSGYTVAHYPVPTTSVTLALGLLDLAIAPQISGKILLTLIVGLFVFGSIYLLKSLNRSERNPLLLVPLVLVFNFSLLFGGLACALGLGGFFVYAGYLFRRSPRPETINPLIVLIASCALFLTHIADYGAAGLVTAAILITQPDRLMLRRGAPPRPPPTLPGPRRSGWPPPAATFTTETGAAGPGSCPRRTWSTSRPRKKHRRQATDTQRPGGVSHEQDSRSHLSPRPRRAAVRHGELPCLR